MTMIGKSFNLVNAASTKKLAAAAEKGGKNAEKTTAKTAKTEEKVTVNDFRFDSTKFLKKLKTSFLNLFRRG